MRKMVLVAPIFFVLSFIHLADAQFGQMSGPSFRGKCKPVDGG